LAAFVPTSQTRASGEAVEDFASVGNAEDALVLAVVSVGTPLLCVESGTILAGPNDVIGPERHRGRLAGELS